MSKNTDILDVFNAKGVLMYRVNLAKMKPIPGHYGYFATASGYILTTGVGGLRLGSAAPYPLAEHPLKRGEGYRAVSVSMQIEGKSQIKNKPVHQLVCLAFNGDPLPGQTDTRHLNGQPHDNRSGNLVWGSHRENYEDSVRHGTAIGLRKGQRHPASKLADTDIPLVRGFHSLGHSLQTVASHFGVTKECIRAVISGETWAHVPGIQLSDGSPAINESRRRRGLTREAA